MMITLNDIGMHRKGRLWINEIPDNTTFIGDTTVTDDIKTSSKNSWDKKSVVLELCLPRNNSNYALLGVEYHPKINDGKIEVQIEASEKENVIYEDSIAMFVKIHIGILPEYAEAIRETLCNYLTQNDFVPSGKLIIRIGAHCEVGSSRKLFSILTEAVMTLLSKDLTQIQNDNIQKLVKEAVKI